MSSRLPRRYRVNAGDKRPLLAMFSDALRAGGARILAAPDPDEAPFVFDLELPAGDRVTATVYLFRATKYHSGSGHERPADEHRFQIKYGSDFAHYHYLTIPKHDDRNSLTLFLGAHLEENIFVGCDPRMHNPTWFSKSVEFKDQHIEQAKRLGWYGWERERVEGGRRKAKPELDYRTETVIAFSLNNLVRYIELERQATRLDPGERLLLAETPVDKRHALERELNLSATEILDLIGHAFRLKVAVRGSAAQVHLIQVIQAVPGVTKVVSLDRDAQPDCEITYRGRRRKATIECKNVLRRSTSHGMPIVEYQKTRASKGDPVCGRFYRVDHCDILAACLHPATARWEYRFCSAVKLPPNPRCPGRVHSKVPVGGENWSQGSDALGQLLDLVTGGR
jgi:hypothetical protein